MFRRLALLCSLAVFVTSAASAANPAKNTGNEKPPDWTKPRLEWFDDQPVTPDPHARAYPAIEAGYGSTITHGRTYKARLGATTSSAAVLVPLAGSKRFAFRVAPNDVPGGWPRVIYDRVYSTNDWGETEPHIVSNDINGTTYHVSAFHRPAIVNNVTDNFMHVNSTTNLSSSGFSMGAPYRLYVPSGYATSGDPWLSTNPASDGIAPRRIYASGIMFNRDANHNGVAPSAVRVWYSDNGGQTWSGGWSIDSRAAGQPILDKPASAVSEYSGTRGYYYIGYTEFSDPIRLWIRRYTNGVTPRCNAVAPIRCYAPTYTEALVSDREAPFAVQIVVNPTNGRLYVFWWPQLTPFGNAEIRMRRSTDGSLANLEPTEYTIARGFTASGQLANGTRAFTMPSAKFNNATNQVALAWHGSDAFTNANAIYYVTFNPDAVTTGNTPLSYSRIDAFGDQYQPALDVDDAGWVLVSYFSHQNSRDQFGLLNNTDYQLYGVAISPSGAINTPYALEPNTHYATWPGDYFGNYYWTGTDGDGARWNVLSCSPPTNVSTVDLKYTGVK